MPMCTYLGDDQYTQPTSNSEINHELASIRAKSNRDLRVSERDLTIKPHRWARARKVKHYSLYLHISGGEFQIINFPPPDGSEYSINRVVQAQTLLAYLYGFQGGMQECRAALAAKGGTSGK